MNLNEAVKFAIFVTKIIYFLCYYVKIGNIRILAMIEFYIFPGIITCHRPSIPAGPWREDWTQIKRIEDKN